MPSSNTVIGHLHLFLCARNEAHKIRTICYEKLVICPVCYAAGENVVVEMHADA